MNQTVSQEVQETILEQLKASKVHGFGFFPYTGIKGFVMLGKDTLVLKDIPSNRGKVARVNVIYDYGSDTYKIHVYGKDGIAPKAIHDEVYFDQMAEIIATEMGVN